MVLMKMRLMIIVKNSLEKYSNDDKNEALDDN